MLRAYGQFHDAGHAQDHARAHGHSHPSGGGWAVLAGLAHSVEVFDGDNLIGGIYGVAVGQMFFGESMFGNVSGASKVALLALCHALELWHWPLLDAQIQSDHLETLGAQSMPRTNFLGEIAGLVDQPGLIGTWCDRFPDIDIAGLAGR